MEVRCPQCHSSIDLADDSPLGDIACPSCGSSFSLLGDETIAHQAAQVRTIGHFELVDQVGAGSFGAVCRARDTELDRTVAVKIPRKGQLDASETEQFLREARAAAQLTHLLGHTDEARRWLDKAVLRVDELAQEKPQGTDTASASNDENTITRLSWTQHLELQILRREAESLLNETEQPASKQDDDNIAESDRQDSGG